LIKRTHIQLSDVRGFHRLASDATVGLTDLVEAMHHCPNLQEARLSPTSLR